MTQIRVVIDQKIPGSTSSGCSGWDLNGVTKYSHNCADICDFDNTQTMDIKSGDEICLWTQCSGGAGVQSVYLDGKRVYFNSNSNPFNNCFKVKNPGSGRPMYLEQLHKLNQKASRVVTRNSIEGP